MSQSTESFIKAGAAGHTWERRSPRPEEDNVLGHTDNWLNALPMGVRPVHLQQEFPRIANDLERLWAERHALELYFDEKEFSPRKDRCGFPPIIKEELLAMHLYYARDRQMSHEERAPQRASLLGENHPGIHEAVWCASGCHSGGSIESCGQQFASAICMQDVADGLKDAMSVERCPIFSVASFTASLIFQVARRRTSSAIEDCVDGAPLSSRH